jgi:hypothetical protein
VGKKRKDYFCVRFIPVDIPMALPRGCSFIIPVKTAVSIVHARNKKNEFIYRLKMNHQATEENKSA